MSDELRAAAELVIADWDRYVGLCPQPLRELAAKKLADAYLAEHPADDGEPRTTARVTEEALRLEREANS